ncbi:MAG TPA: sulfatase-like hydrolase/transferase [Rhizobiaceae bacterium]|nr:sulfatase-like hydrolase/transferase [Rhizobiaceae bacterium]
MSRIKLFLERCFRILIHPAALVLATLAGGLFVYGAENQVLSLPFGLAIAATLFAAIFIVSARLAFSVYAAWGVVVLITVVSAIKYRMKGFSLHFYDFVFFANDTEVHRFLLSSYLYLILPVIGALLLAIALAVAFYRSSPRSDWPAHLRTLPLVIGVVLLPATFPAEAQNERVFYYLRGRQMSAFFVSLLDIRNLFARSELEARLQQVPRQQPFSQAVDCGDTSKLPDIYVVLSETQIDPAIFPQIKDGKEFAHKYAPLSGALQPMSVETFGGGTWITNLSLMSGLAATDFGWRSPYLTVLLESHVAGALPEILAHCGYRTAAQTPMSDSFVNDGPYMRSIGVETVMDIDDIGAPNYHMRDSFYFDKAEEFIARHRKEDGRPLFLEIQTMFPHSPYNERLEPEITLPDEPFDRDPGVAEYLRRMAIAKGDFEKFLEARQAEGSTRPAIVLEFGDHQAFVTKDFVDETAGEDALSRPGSLAYRTYYEITSYGYELKKPLPHYPALDVGFLAPTLLEVAGLPMTPMMADLLALRDHCEGVFYACRDRAAVDRHLRRRVDSGMLRLFPTDEIATGSVRP